MNWGDKTEYKEPIFCETCLREFKGGEKIKKNCCLSSVLDQSIEQINRGNRNRPPQRKRYAKREEMQELRIVR